MKKKGNRCDYLEERNRNLVREFTARLGVAVRNISDVFDALTRLPADRFYISEERAYEIIRSLKTGTSPSVHISRRRGMLEEIMRRVDLLQKEHPGMTLKDAVFEVVNSPAPGFFLSAGSIRSILYALRA